MNTSAVESRFLTQPGDLGVVCVGFSGGQVRDAKPALCSHIFPTAHPCLLFRIVPVPRHVLPLHPWTVIVTDRIRRRRNAKLTRLAQPAAQGRCRQRSCRAHRVGPVLRDQQ